MHQCIHDYNVTGLCRRAVVLTGLALIAACAGQPTTDDGARPPATASAAAPAEPQPQPVRPVEPQAASVTVTQEVTDGVNGGGDQPAARASRTDAPSLREDAPLRYVVKKGDTLWDIASYFLNDPFYWPELWYANPDIENPHLIYPGEILYLIYVDGRPRLSRTPGNTRGQRLSPRARVRPIADAIPTIPLDAIQQFLNGPRLVTEAELDAAPYIVDFDDQHLVGGAGNVTYVRGATPGGGPVYSVVRPGSAYTDPQTGEVLGYEAAPIGEIDIREYADVSTAVLTRTFREALPGDRLLPLETAALASNFYPRAPEHTVNGQVISVYGGVARVGQYQIVTLNRGARDDLARGHVLDVYQTGRRARDPLTGERVTLPAVKAGTLLVFKVEDKVSYGLVMRATRAIRVLDSVRNPD